MKITWVVDGGTVRLQVPKGVEIPTEYIANILIHCIGVLAACTTTSSAREIVDEMYILYEKVSEESKRKVN